MQQDYLRSIVGFRRCTTQRRRPRLAGTYPVWACCRGSHCIAGSCAAMSGCERRVGRGLLAVRILVANKFWYRRAGLERVMFDEIGWLEDAGHEVAHFSTQHPENDASPWSDYFAPYLEIGPQTTLTSAREGDRRRAHVLEHGRRGPIRPPPARLPPGRRARARDPPADLAVDPCSRRGGPESPSCRRCTTTIRSARPAICSLRGPARLRPGDAAGRSMSSRASSTAVCTRAGRRAPSEPPSSSGADGWSATSSSWTRSYRRAGIWPGPSARAASVAGRSTCCRTRSPRPHVLPDVPPGEAFVYAGRLSREKGLATLAAGG